MKNEPLTDPRSDTEIKNFITKHYIIAADCRISIKRSTLPSRKLIDIKVYQGPRLIGWHNSSDDEALFGQLKLTLDSQLL